MGLTKKILKVRNSRDARKSSNVEFLVDSGAVYSLVPAHILKRLGLKPYRKLSFFLADGTEIKREVGDAYFSFNGGSAPSPVIFGEKGDEPLLGAVTLESLGLVLDPFRREIYPIQRMLL